MQHIHIKMDGDGAWPELANGKAIELPTDGIKVAFLDNGTDAGNPVVMFRSDGDGIAYILQLTVKNLQMITAASKGKYGDIT